MQPRPQGDAYLRRIGFADVHVGASIGYIAVISTGSRLVAYLALRFLHAPGPRSTGVVRLAGDADEPKLQDEATVALHVHHELG